MPAQPVGVVKHRQDHPLLRSRRSTSSSFGTLVGEAGKVRFAGVPRATATLSLGQKAVRIDLSLEASKKRDARWRRHLAAVMRRVKAVRADAPKQCRSCRIHGIGPQCGPSL